VFFQRKHRADLRADGARHISLQYQYLAEVPVIALSPEVSIRATVDQLNVDANSLADAQHGSFDDAVDGQLASDVWQRPRPAPKLHDRGSRRHANSPQLPKTRDQRVSHSRREVVLLRVSGQIL